LGVSFGQFFLAHASPLIEFYRMSRVTISLPAALDASLETRASAAGFRSKEDYLVALVQADCDRADLEAALEARLKGPFEPLEPA
jgi:hypothetical protein